MEYQVKKEIEVILKLTQKEFNTIVSAYGATSHSERCRIADVNSFLILGDEKSEIFYSKLKKIAQDI